MRIVEIVGVIKAHFTVSIVRRTLALTVIEKGAAFLDIVDYQHGSITISSLSATMDFVWWSTHDWCAGKLLFADVSKFGLTRHQLSQWRTSAKYLLIPKRLDSLLVNAFDLLTPLAFMHWRLRCRMVEILPILGRWLSTQNRLAHV